MDAVERSFGQLSLKAKKPREKDADPKTPQSLKRTLTTLNPNVAAHTNSEISPLLIVQQCLDLLVELSTKNPHIPWLFLTEHDIVGSSLKRSASRKGKGKDSKSHKYAINSLLTLLDRELVMESSVVMMLLADLLYRLTLPLQNLVRRRKEATEQAKSVDEGSNTAAGEPASAAAAPITNENENAPTDPSNTESATSQQPIESQAAAEAQGSVPPEKLEAVEKKKSKRMQVPVIPHYNLTLVIKIFVARECSSKTFQNTISAIKNLSAIPGAKIVFGQELVRQARLLSQNIVADLDDLYPHIEKAASGTEIQGVALAKFSPGASEQNKSPAC